MGQHAPIQEGFAQIAQSLLDAGTATIELGIVDRGPEQDARNGAAAEAQSEREWQGQMVDRLKVDILSADALRVASHHPPTGEGPHQEGRMGAQPVLEGTDREKTHPIGRKVGRACRISAASAGDRSRFTV